MATGILDSPTPYSYPASPPPNRIGSAFVMIVPEAGVSSLSSSITKVRAFFFFFFRRSARLNSVDVEDFDNGAIVRDGEKALMKVREESVAANAAVEMNKPPMDVMIDMVVVR